MATNILHSKDSVISREEKNEVVDNFCELYDNGTVEKRNSAYDKMVNMYYDLVTDLYVYGWGRSFHFAQRYKHESFKESILRAEHYLALKLQVQRNDKILDLGCGVGGPARNIARFTGGSVLGVNNNEYQLRVATKMNKEEGVTNVSYLKCDFMKLPLEENSFNAAYAIEATCHAPDKVACFKQILRALKPGGIFAAYEWCVTDSYNPENEEERRIIHSIEKGNSLPRLYTTTEVIEALEEAGFEIMDYEDRQENTHSEGEITWYQPLEGSVSLSGFRQTRVGRMMTHMFLSTLETIRLAPQGSSKVTTLLEEASVNLVEGGKRNIFTPSFLFVARKPANGKTPKKGGARRAKSPEPARR